MTHKLSAASSPAERTRRSLAAIDAARAQATRAKAARAKAPRAKPTKSVARAREAVPPAPPQQAALAAPAVSPQRQRLMGDIPDDAVPVKVRVWNGAKLALWKSKTGWEIARKQAAEILARCRHVDGCPGRQQESEPCSSDCPDRETRMSALVILSAARAHEPVSVSRLADQPYMMPSREFVSSLVAELCACQAELEVLRGTVVTVPPAEPPQLQEKT